MVLMSGAVCVCLGYKEQQGPILEKKEHVHLLPLNSLSDHVYRK